MARFARVTGAQLDRPVRELERFVAEARAYDGVRKRATQHGVPFPQLTMAYAESLFVLVRAARPDRVLETGVWKGITSAYMLEAMRRNGNGGRLVSIDLPTFNAEGMVNADGVRDRIHVDRVGDTGILVDPEMRTGSDRWSLRLGDAKELLPKALAELGEIDLFYHDSEHSYSHMSFEFSAVWPSLRRGGLLVSDDISFSTGSRRAWSELVARANGVAWNYFRSDGSRGVLRK